MGPLIPRPAVTMIALALTGGLLGTIGLDAFVPDFDGRVPITTLALLISGILGFDLYRGSRKDQDGPS